MRAAIISSFRSGAALDVLTLASGRLGAAAISLVSAPFIARLFEPAHYGVAALFIAVAAPASILLPLAFQNAIVVPRETAQAKALVRLSIALSMLLCGLAIVLLVAAYVLAIPIPLADRLGGWLWMLPLAALVLSLSMVCEGWLTRTRGFASSAKATFAQATVTSGGRLSFGALWGTSVWGLIGPYVVALAVRLGMLAKAAWNRRCDDGDTAPVREVASEFREFPKYNLPAGFLRALSDNLPVIFFAPIFGAAAAGFYAMADRLIKSPMTMGAMSVRRVYLQRASAILHRGGNLKRSYLKATGYLALLGLPPLLLLMLVGQPLMEFVLGERWAQAGAFVEILAPWLYLMLISRPATALVDLLRQQRLWLRIQISSALFRMLAMLLAWQWGESEEWVLWGFVLGGAPPYLLLMVYVNQLIDRKGVSVTEKQGDEN